MHITFMMEYLNTHRGIYFLRAVSNECLIMCCAVLVKNAAKTTTRAVFNTYVGVLVRQHHTYREIYYMK